MTVDARDLCPRCAQPLATFGNQSTPLGEFCSRVCAGEAEILDRELLASGALHLLTDALGGSREARGVLLSACPKRSLKTSEQIMAEVFARRREALKVGE